MTGTISELLFAGFFLIFMSANFLFVLLPTAQCVRLAMAIMNAAAIRRVVYAAGNKFGGAQICADTLTTIWRDAALRALP